MRQYKRIDTKAVHAGTQMSVGIEATMNCWRIFRRRCGSSAQAPSVSNG